MGEREYATIHRHRGNLLIHLVAVPVFVLANVSLLAGIFRQDVMGIIVSAGFIALSLGAQKLGHGLEGQPPQPFSGPAGFMRRIYREQFYGFRVFLLGGGWLRNWRAGNG